MRFRRRRKTRRMQLNKRRRPPLGDGLGEPDTFARNSVSHCLRDFNWEAEPVNAPSRSDLLVRAGGVGNRTRQANVSGSPFHQEAPPTGILITPPKAPVKRTAQS